ncbi:ABC transporter ATP-binding protein [Parvicella tangerina]|uniref:Vitamin B12 import ATP-binding protein BtuD n=1 Tax=Parvicella tangerina TaxID=2829795 RepID=A0A916NE53_9FLAO|nr:ABC transporter ATP-binding protein [Parvicella tangerina]CAG5086231.1 Vitamin B12 import ATP-binding protein BtuD [Parvicella tangerina]
MSDLLLHIENLTTTFTTESGKTTAVDNVSLKLEKGKILGVVGESGSGKSVTSLSAMGLIPSPPGKIENGNIWLRVKGEMRNVVNFTQRQFQAIRGNEIAMIFQEPMTSLNPVYTCGEQVVESILRHDKQLASQSLIVFWAEKLLKTIVNLTIKPVVNVLIIMINVALFVLKLLFVYPIFYRSKGERFSEASKRLVLQPFAGYRTKAEKRAEEKTLELFKKVMLPRPSKIFSSYPHQISGGQKQRVMIAMALSCNPQVLIADEPTTALDVTVQKTILDIIKDLQKEFEMGVVFITHDLAVIAELADEIAVMYKGKIVEQGSVRDVFLKPKHPYTKGLLACRPPLDIRLSELPTRKYFVHENEQGVLVQTSKNIEELIEELKVDESEIKMKHEILYAADPLIRVEGLKTHFPMEKNVFGKPTDFVKAVDDVSFNVYPGETLGLVGESGCGKTTLGRTLLRLVEATGGQVSFGGLDVLNMKKEESRKLRKDVQIIFQDPYSSLNPRMRIGEAIMEPMRVHGICDNDFQRKQEVMELLVRVGLKEEHFDRYPHEFSGGQRQRICIARSIALKPKFVICDESVSALDVSVQADVLNLLNELRNEFGLTYLFISHDLSVVKFMSDRIIVMNKGKIEEVGTADEIYKNPKSLYTQSLIEAIPKGIVA